MGQFDQAQEVFDCYAKLTKFQRFLIRDLVLVLDRDIKLPERGEPQTEKEMVIRAALGTEEGRIAFAQAAIEVYEKYKPEDM